MQELALSSHGTVVAHGARAAATLAALLDATEDAVVILDARAGITGWNRGAERLFGYPEPEVLGQPAAALFPEHLRPELERMLAAVLSAGHRADRMETEVRRRDGAPTPVALTVSPLVGVHGGAVAVARDVTEQRLTQARLAEVEAHMREAEAQAHVGRWLWDVRTGVVQWSEGLHRLHDVDPFDFEGTLDAHLACAHPDDRALLRRAVTEAVATVRPCDLEHRVAPGDGPVRWVHTRAEPTLDSAGAVVGLRGIVRDITWRRA